MIVVDKIIDISNINIVLSRDFETTNVPKSPERRRVFGVNSLASCPLWVCCLATNIS